MKEIHLSKGLVALVDDDDFEYVAQFKWCALVGKKTYAVRGLWVNRKYKMEYMHRVILTPIEGTMTDHIDGNGLNNQRNNLRYASSSQNQWNKPAYSNNKSGFKGITWDKKNTGNGTAT